MDTPDAIDLDAYLRRTGHAPVAAPTLRALRTLAAAHVATIAFENLNPFLGVPVELELPAVQRKLVAGGRGGYCFEHNLLFGAALRAIGFEVTNLTARVLWGRPDDAITARSHMLLRVDVDGQARIVDVGFGGMTLTGVLELEADVQQATPHEPFRLVRLDGDWLMQARVRDAWRTLYRFDLQPQYPIDYRASNYYLSTHPESHFVTGLSVARAAPGRRLALRDREFAVHTTGGGTERRTLADAAQIRDVLQDAFLIHVPDHPQLDRRLDALPPAGSP
jgi:N-hydroxyarylamine O-acetyltransferase